MDKCKHGYSVCSECGIQSEITEDIEERRIRHKKTVAFDKICAEIMGLREIWESKTKLYVFPSGFKIQRSQFNPYSDVNDLTAVIDYIMKAAPDENLDDLVVNIKNTSVLFGFREFVKEYHKNHVR